MKKPKLTVLCAAAIASLAAAAIAVPPGYTWGAGNCGYPGNISEAGCKLCCRAGLSAGRINDAQYDGCVTFCEAHQWPRPGTGNLLRLRDALVRILA